MQYFEIINGANSIEFKLKTIDFQQIENNDETIEIFEVKQKEAHFPLGVVFCS